MLLELLLEFVFPTELLLEDELFIVAELLEEEGEGLVIELLLVPLELVPTDVPLEVELGLLTEVLLD